MNAQECVMVVAYIAARCPAMRLEDATPTAWFEDLERFTFADCRQAAHDISSRQAFVGIHELIAETERIERTRRGRERVAALAAADEAEARALAAVPAEPVDREALRSRLAAMASRGKPLGRAADPRRDMRRMAEARAELDALRARGVPSE